MMWLMFLSCMSNEAGPTEAPLEKDNTESPAIDWMLGFGTSMDGDIEPCG